MSFGSPNLRSTHRSKVAPPPFAPSLLERREPATERLQRKHDQKPHRGYPPEGQSQPGGLLPWGRAEQPAGIAERCPGERDRKRMDQNDVQDIEEERHPPEGGDPARGPAMRPLEQREQDQRGSERHHQIEQRGRILLAIEE